MKIKLAYPKIPDTLNCPLKQCIAFEKYDGTNIHVVWRRDYGWESYGTRRDSFLWMFSGIGQFEQAHPELKGVAALWDPESKLDNYLTINYPNAQEIIVFAEYFGVNSFAGQHKPADQMQLVIFDIQVDGKMLSPEELIEEFKDFNIANVVFKGKFTGQLFIDVRKGKYPVNEGVVVKGIVDDQVYMCKIKTEAYLDRLKTEFKDNWKEYWE
jgi:hypothetical protein